MHYLPLVNTYLMHISTARTWSLCLLGAGHLMLLNVLGDCDGSRVQMPKGQCHAHLSTTTQIKAASCALSNSAATLLFVLQLLPITVTLEGFCCTAHKGNPKLLVVKWKIVRQLGQIILTLKAVRGAKLFPFSGQNNFF